jgi:hypothetical protein
MTSVSVVWLTWWCRGHNGEILGIAEPGCHGHNDEILGIAEPVRWASCLRPGDNDRPIERAAHVYAREHFASARLLQSGAHGGVF